MPNLGFWEIMVLALVVLLVFGAKRLPEIGSSLGKGIREFKKSFSETQDAVTGPLDTSTTRQLDAPAQPPVSSEPKRLSQ
jgi:sec-independent protein translocase protein TatA